MKIAQKIVSVIITLIISATLLSTAAFADIGPKPSLEVRFTGINGENCWAALLCPENYHGGGGDIFLPFDYKDPADEIKIIDSKDADAVKTAMNDYKDADGFIIQKDWGYPRRVVERSILKSGVYPPENFKILLYFPDSSEFFVTPVYECYALNTYYTIDVSMRQNGSVTAISSYYHAKEIVFLIIRILLTIGIELLIARLFKFKEKRQTSFIAIVNIITQILLNISINLIYFKMGVKMIFLYIPLELAVFIIEAILYAKFLKTPEGEPVKVIKAVGYALIANFVSFFLGVFLVLVTKWLAVY